MEARGTLAATLRYSNSKRGKPLLVGAPEIQFSLAHSRGRLIEASGRAVGVELEHLSGDLNDLTFQSFSPNKRR